MSDGNIAIELPGEDIIKTLNMLAAVYKEKQSSEITALLPTVICNQLYAYRREMIANYKRGDKKKGKELEQWL